MGEGCGDEGGGIRLVRASASCRARSEYRRLRCVRRGGSARRTASARHSGRGSRCRPSAAGCRAAGRWCSRPARSAGGHAAGGEVPAAVESARARPRSTGRHLEPPADRRPTPRSLLREDYPAAVEAFADRSRLSPIGGTAWSDPKPAFSYASRPPPREPLVRPARRSGPHSNARADSVGSRPKPNGCAPSSAPSGHISRRWSKRLSASTCPPCSCNSTRPARPPTTWPRRWRRRSPTPGCRSHPEFPGLGTRLRARGLAEIGDDRARLPTPAGSSPTPVLHPSSVRPARSPVSPDVGSRTTASTTPATSGHSRPCTRHPVPRAHHRRRTDHGDWHAAAQRKLCNRMLGQLHHCLQQHGPFDEQIAFPTEIPAAA